MTKLEINRNMISKNQNCRHQAYDEKCLPCMYGFAIFHKTEIERDGLDETIKKQKAGGNFL